MIIAKVLAVLAVVVLALCLFGMWCLIRIGATSDKEMEVIMDGEGHMAGRN